MEHHVRRRERLAQAVAAAGLGAVFVTKPAHVTYLTGFTGDSSFVVVTPGRTILLSDDRFAGQIGDECPDVEVRLRGHDRNTYQLAAEVIDRLGVRAVGVESAHLTLAEFETMSGLVPTAAWAPTKCFVEDLRVIKDVVEVAAIRAAVAVAGKAFAAFRALLQPGDTEKDLADRMESFVRRAGGTGSSFPAIVAAAERSALPHCPPTHKALDGAGFVLVDWGAKVDGYGSDLTRVLLLPASFDGGQAGRRGDVESRLRSLYTVVSEAQRRAVAALRPGASVKDVDAAARGYLAERGYADKFTHGLGHGLGLETHESPAVRSNSEDVIRAGMVLTIEPGVYVPGFGGVRIEDDILVTADGAEVLSERVPRELELE